MQIVSLSRLQLTAFIDEAGCIGCTKCIRACPVDAIIGSSRIMHTVISELCTGCDHCVEVCPTNCIQMQLPSSDNPNTSPDKLVTLPRNPLHFSGKYRINSRQLVVASVEDTSAPPNSASLVNIGTISRDTRKREVAAAIARVRARKASQQ